MLDAQADKMTSIQNKITLYVRFSVKLFLEGLQTSNFSLRV